MSAIEETLARIGLMGGVESYVITDGKGNILRQSKTMVGDLAVRFASEMLRLTSKAQHVVRDLDPKNELHFFRLRTKEKEILAAPGEDFMVVVVQKWRPAAEAEAK